MSITLWSTVILIQREPHDLGNKIFENQLWLVIQVLQASLASPCAGLCRGKGCQGRKVKQSHRSHKMLFGWWLQPDCTMPSRLFPEFLCLLLYPNRPKTYQAWTHTHTLPQWSCLWWKGLVLPSSLTESPAAPSEGQLLMTLGAPIHTEGDSFLTWNYTQYSNCFPVTFLSLSKNWHHWPVSLPPDMLTEESCYASSTPYTVRERTLTLTCTLPKFNTSTASPKKPQLKYVGS